MEGGGQRLRDRSRALHPHVHDLDPRRRGAVGPRAQRAARQRPPGLGARGRRAVDHGGAGRPRPPRRDLAGVVARAGVLLVRRVVLLVDDDQAEPRHRGEHGAPRAQHHVGLALAHAPVLLGPLGPRHRRVPDAHGLAQARPQARQQLGRQGDLGDEDDRAAPGRADLGDRPQVDLGLARPGHPVQQQRAAVAHRPAHALERLALVGGELGRDVGRRRLAAHRAQRARGGGLGREGDGPVGRHAPQRRHGRPRSAAEVGGGHRATRLRERRRDRPAAGAARLERAGDQRGRQPLGRTGGRRRQHPVAARAAPQGPVGARRQHQLQAGGGGRQVVARRPERELDQLRRDRRRVDHPRQRRQPALVGRRAAPHHHAQHPAAAERARHQGAGHGAVLEIGRDGVVEHPVEAAGLDQGVDLGRGGPPGRRRRRGCGGPARGRRRPPPRRSGPAGRRPRGRCRWPPR